MARSRITSEATNNLGADDGTTLFSFTEREKRNLSITLNSTQFSDISNMTITAVLLEANNTGDGTKPVELRSGSTPQTIPVIAQATTNLNEFAIRFDVESLISGWTVQPSPGKPVYGFISVTIDDGTGINSQEFEILRGMLEVVYSVGV